MNYEDIEEMLMDGVCYCPECGNTLELDGVCHCGGVSPLLEMGMI